MTEISGDRLMQHLGYVVGEQDLPSSILIRISFMSFVQYAMNVILVKDRSFSEELPQQIFSELGIFLLELVQHLCFDYF
jgi:hypothetical protein